MKRILSFVTAFSFLLSGFAIAAPGDQPMTKPAFGQRPVGRPGNPGGKPPDGSKPPAHRPPHHRPPHKPTPLPGPKPPGHRPPIHRPPIHRPPVHRPPVHRPPPNHHRPPPGWHKPRPSQWYWRGHWINRIRGPVFAYPRGYNYRYWYSGDILPALFLSAQYFYDDVGPLGLQVPPPGYRWVRYGPDLLLVNLRTGEVEEVANGVFY